MKLLLPILVGSAFSEQALSRKRRDATPQECRTYCDDDNSMGLLEGTLDECYAKCGGAPDAEEDLGQCQNYEIDAFQLCCPNNLDVDHYWPYDRPDARGERPIAEEEMCPTGCQVAKQVDLFACSFFERINLLQQMLDELDTFIDADLDDIIEFKKQFVRRYREVEGKSVRSASKMASINEKMMAVIRITQENNRLIQDLESQVATLEGQAAGIQGQIDELHEFCKIGKQCAKQCFFDPELFGGIKKNCAEYYKNPYWTSQDARDKEFYNAPQSGIYIIQPHASLAPKYAYCDQKTDGGGWTLLQHNGVSRPELWELYSNDTMKYKANWAQNWNNYKHGFGHIMCNGEADFWIGLDYMHYLTHPRKNGGQKQVGRIDINDWDVDENGNGGEYWGYYNTFVVQDEGRNYQLMARNFNGVGSYSIGNAFEGIAFGGNDKQKAYTKQDGMEFSTKGEWKNGKVGGEWIHDNDRLCKPKGFHTKYGNRVPKWSADDIAAQCDDVINFDYSNWTKNMAKWGSCAQQDGAGFWYNRCSAGNLNGQVYRNGYYELKTISITRESGETREMMRNEHDDGLVWTTLHNKGKDYSFMMAEIRIRPKDFQPNPMEGSKSTMRNGGQPDQGKMQN